VHESVFLRRVTERRKYRTPTGNKNEAQQAIERYSSVFETMKIYKGMVARPEDSVYWNMTVEYGIRYMKMLSEWCDSCIKILEDVEK